MSRKATKIVIAKLGKQFSYSDLAARALYGDPKLTPGIVLRPFRTIRGCLTAVRDKRVNYAVVPIRNKIIGEVPRDKVPKIRHMATDMNLRKTDEYKLVLQLTLASNGILKEVDTAYSKDEALGQCTKFCKLHNIEARPEFPDGKPVRHTTDAAAYVARTKVRYCAAICSPEAARHHKLHILKNNIADDRRNYTIFHAYAPPA